MIRIKLGGGLGNQLFQWQAALIVGLLSNQNVQIDLRGVLGNSRDAIGITAFNLPFKKIISYKSGIRPILRSPQSIRYLKYQSFPWYSHPKLLLEEGFESFPSRLILDRIQKDAELLGFFQSSVLSEYFRNHFYNLSEIEVQKGKQSEYKNLQSQILSERPVILHMRKGDYVSKANQWGVLSPSYYVNALKLMGVGRDEPIYVFSDNPNLAKSELTDCGSDFSYRYISTSRKLSAAHVMKLMSLGSRHVISNSTFAWWGAFLSHSQIIVAPEKFYKNHHDNRERYPKSWKLCASVWN